MKTSRNTPTPTEVIRLLEDASQRLPVRLLGLDRLLHRATDVLSQLLWQPISLVPEDEFVLLGWESPDCGWTYDMGWANGGAFYLPSQSDGTVVTSDREYAAFMRPADAPVPSHFACP